ncbi:hypothetical protein TURU_159668 [Turdus rufiventris]|nr:hypothetical protein TURU_159668 [Turdus rufiventris]
MTFTEAEVAAHGSAVGPYRGGSAFVSLRSAIPAWLVMARDARGGWDRAFRGRARDRETESFSLEKIQSEAMESEHHRVS